MFTIFLEKDIHSAINGSNFSASNRFRII